MSASIKSIFLESFQCHERTKLALAGPGQVTIIVGPTDSGKTAIVRALRWLLYNIPQGLDFIQVGKHTATVAIELADGTKLARERSKSANRYRITKPGASPVTLEGFGNAVPVEVQELTGVRNVTIGDLELALNLSEQLDGPFLGQKSTSGPTRAKILGKLSGTEEVDEAQRQLGTDLFRASQEEKRLLSEIEALDAKIREYDYLPALAEKIAALEGLLTAVRDAQQRLGTLEVAQQKLTAIQSQRAQALTVLVKWRGLREAASHLESAEADHSKAQELAKHRVSLASISTQREQWSKYLARWTNLPEARSLALEADAAYSRAASLTGLKEALAATRAGQVKAQAAIGRWAHLEETEDLVAQCFVVSTRADNLERLSLKLTDLSAQIAQISKTRNRWAGLDEASNALSAASGASERFLALTRLSDALMKVRQAQVVAEAEFDRHAKALTDAQVQYRDMLISLGTCPVCGSKIDPSLLKEVA